jgi:hypothetical protein
MVEVVAADAVEPAMSAITAELAELALELRDLVADAQRLEGLLQDKRNEGGVTAPALPLLEEVFAGQSAAVRDGLRAELEEAVREAERRVSAARAEATAVLAGFLSSDAGPVAGPVDRGVRSPGTTPATDGWQGMLRGEFGSGRDSLPDDRAAVAASDFGEQLRRAASGFGPKHEAEFDLEAPSPFGPGAGAESTTVQAAPERNPSALSGQGALPAEDDPPMTTVLRTDAAAPTPPSAAVDEEPTPFGRFWTEQGNSPNARRRSAIVDALLPVLAVAIIALVVLSWLG